MTHNEIIEALHHNGVGPFMPISGWDGLTVYATGPDSFGYILRAMQNLDLPEFRSNPETLAIFIPNLKCDHCSEPVSYCDETRQWLHSRAGVSCFLSNGKG